MTAPMLHPDGLKRCPWPKQTIRSTSPITTRNGACRNTTTARSIEKLMLDGFQAGLSWITILRKRDNFRRAFDGFEPEKIARYTPDEGRALMQDAGIVRNRVKIEGTVCRRAPISTSWKRAGLLRCLWDLRRRQAEGQPLPTSRAGAGRDAAVARDVEGAAGRGFKFVGPTIVYAFMQAVGMVNDHLVTCIATAMRGNGESADRRLRKLPPRTR